MSAYSFYDNKRDTPRVNSSVYIKYEIRNEMNVKVGSGIATTRDISVGGARFLSTTPASKGYILKMQIQLDTFTTLGVVGTVAWVEQTRPGQYQLGVQFKSLGPSERQKLISFLNKNAPQD